MESLKEFAGEMTVYCLGLCIVVALIKLLWTSTREDETATDSNFNLFLQTAPPPAVHMSVPLLQTERENDMTEINLRNEAVQTTLSNDDFENEYSELIENDVIESESTVQSNEPIENSLTDSATNEPQASENLLNIKLHYLDDGIRVMVQSSPQETIGDFKRKHSNREHIHFVFMGKILVDNEATLSSVGFYDNCVVNCLMHYQDEEGYPLLNILIFGIGYFFREIWNMFLLLICLVSLFIFVICFIQVRVIKVLRKYFEPIIFIVVVFFGLYNVGHEHLRW